MRTRTLSGTLAAVLVAAAASAEPVLLSNTFNADFSASRSLWSGGPGAALNTSAASAGDIGVYYSVVANSGTVNATQHASLVANYLSETIAGSMTRIGLDFVGDAGGGSVQALFGASVEAGIFMDSPFDVDIPLIDRGFFLDPTTTHTPVLDVRRDASDAATAFGIGGVDLLVGTLGATLNLDLKQNISFTATGLSGVAFYENAATGQTGSAAFTIPTDGPFNLDLDLGPGVWNVSFLDVGLLNSFRNDIDLGLRPALDYVVGTWPPVGNTLFSFGLVDQTFSLGFNRISQLGSVRVSVLEAPEQPPTGVPEPGSLALFGIGLAVLSARRRRETPALRAE